MADDIDLASERIDAEMQARLRVLPTFNTASLDECQDCGEEIPSKRHAISDVFAPSFARLINIGRNPQCRFYPPAAVVYQNDLFEPA